MDFSALNEMVRKFIVVIPNVIAAIVILVAGYFLARLASSLVMKLLSSLKILEKFEDLKAEEKSRPIELIGSLTFYLIMLFILLAFFNVLNLPIIAGPISSLANTVMEYLPRVVGASILLFLAWIVAKILRWAILRGLNLLKFDERVSSYYKRPEGTSPSSIIATITFYFVLLFALPPFLETLGLSSVTKPLSEMWGSFTGILPNLLATAIILVLGFFIARIIREIVANLLVGFGLDRGAEKIGMDKSLGELKVSGIIATIVYVLVLIPVLIAALDTLKIPAISDPGKEMLSIILNKLPSIFAAAILLIAAVIFGKILMPFLARILHGIGFDRLMEGMGIKQIGTASPSQVVGIVVFVYILFFAVMEAAEILNFTKLALLSSEFVTFAFKVLLAAIILGVGILIGNWVKGLIQGAAQERPFLGTVAKAAIVVFALAIALQTLDVANEIVILSFGLLLGSIAVAAAIAFGIGAKDVAGREVEDWVKKWKGEKTSGPKGSVP